MKNAKTVQQAYVEAARAAGDEAAVALYQSLVPWTGVLSVRGYGEAGLAASMYVAPDGMRAGGEIIEATIPDVAAVDAVKPEPVGALVAINLLMIPGTERPQTDEKGRTWNWRTAILVDYIRTQSPVSASVLPFKGMTSESVVSKFRKPVEVVTDPDPEVTEPAATSELPVN